MTSSSASSAPEFSISGTSSIDDAEEIALYEQYLSISHARQSNPSPEMRKKMFDDLAQMQQRALPRSRSEVNTVPTEQSQQQQQQKQEQQQQQQTTTSQIKPVGKFFSFLHMNLLDYVIVSLLMSKH
jgi:site-specific recombinase XerD